MAAAGVTQTAAVRGAAAINIDVSQTSDLCSKFSKEFTEESAKRLFTYVMKDTGRHIRRYLGQEVKKDYRAKHGVSSWVHKETGAARITNSETVSALGVKTSVGCVIPIRGVKGHMGVKSFGKFKATGGVPGWKSVKYAGAKRYKIKAQIVNSNITVLPTNLKEQGTNKVDNNAPFINTSTKGRTAKLNYIAFVRLTKKRMPIMPVMALGTPQMVRTRSADKIQRDTVDYVETRMEHYYFAAVNGYIKGVK